MDDETIDEEVLEGQIYEESYQDDPDEVSHVEDPDETFDEDEVLISTLPLDEEIQAPALLTHEDKEMAIFSHTNGLMKETLDMVNEHIDTFIQTGRHTWDFGRFSFDRDPIYDNEGISQTKGLELSSSKDWSPCVYDSDVWHPDDDMVTDLFRPFKDDLSWHFQSDFQSSLGNCDTDPFGDAKLFYEDFQPPSSSFLDEHQDMVIPEESKAHSTKRKYFHLEDFYSDSRIKRQHFSFYKHEMVPYLFSSSLRNHRAFLGSLVSSHSSGSNGVLKEDEDSPLSLQVSPLQRWIDQVCGHSF
jgi:hypothetical protein